MLGPLTSLACSRVSTAARVVDSVMGTGPTSAGSVATVPHEESSPLPSEALSKTELTSGEFVLERFEAVMESARHVFLGAGLAPADTRFLLAGELAFCLGEAAE